MSETTTAGYVYCRHQYCFAIVIGAPGTLCDDCAGEPDANHCDGCDNDSDVCPSCGGDHDGCTLADPHCAAARGTQ